MEPVTTTATLAIVGLTWFAQSAASGICGNVSHDQFVGIVSATRDRVMGLSLPENHDVAKAVRTAQIHALERVIRDYRAAGRPEWVTSPYTYPGRFFDGSLAFCERAIGRWSLRRPTFSLEVSASLVQALDDVFAPRTHPPIGTPARAPGGPAAAGLADGPMSATLMDFADNAVLDELLDAVPGLPLPTDFEAHFRRGTAAHQSFRALFGAYVSEQVKTNARFRDIFVAGQLAMLKQFAAATQDTATTIEERTARIEAALEQFRLGDFVIDGRRGPHLTLSRFPKRRQAAAVAEHRHRASEAELRLLDPFTQGAPLVGRDAALAACWAWLRDELPITVRTLVAPAGTGKTRLALELCDAAVADGWEAGFVERDELARFAAAGHRAEWTWDRPTLVVVDDAAEHAPRLGAWLAELAENPGADERPLRLLLLERAADSDSGWWASLAGSGPAAAVVRDLFDPPTPVHLPALVAAEDRRAVFAGMLERLRAPITLPPPGDPTFERRLAQLTWGGEPLFLMMAALAARRSGLGSALGLSRADVADLVAGFELYRVRRYAPGQVGDGANDSARLLLTHLAAYATLVQGLSASEAPDVIAREQEALRLQGAGDPLVVLEWFRRALPGVDGGVAPVRPDAVGEALVLRALGAGQARAADATVLRAADHAWERVTAFAARLAQDVGGATDADGARAATPLAWMDRLAAAAWQDVTRLRMLVAQLPSDTLVLRERAAAWTQHVVDLLREQPDDGDTLRPDLADAFTDLSIRLADVGRREDALAAVEEAVALYRDLAAVYPDAFRPDLARALNTRSHKLSAVGRREDALTTMEKAVALYRDLAAVRPDAFRPGLARALNNWSIQLSAVGRHEDALTAVEEAVEVYRDLAAVYPDAFRPDLALVLSNQSNQLSEVGRHEDALATSEESFETLVPYFRANAALFASWMRLIVQSYDERADASGIEPRSPFLPDVRATLARFYE